MFGLGEARNGRSSSSLRGRREMSSFKLANEGTEREREREASGQWIERDKLVQHGVRRSR